MSTISADIISTSLSTSSLGRTVSHTVMRLRDGAQYLGSEYADLAIVTDGEDIPDDLVRAALTPVDEEGRVNLAAFLRAHDEGSLAVGETEAEVLAAAGITLVAASMN